MNIVPIPNWIEKNEGHFFLHKNTEIIDTTNFKLNFFNEVRNKLRSRSFLNNKMRFLENSSLSKDEYHLDINEDIINIYAADFGGFFYAWQTLLQLMPVEIYDKNQKFDKLNIPCCTIKDKPRFKYRGMHLDVSRHFFGVDVIKSYIDLIAFHKMNVFHWHLTDDNGWRIEIKKYPKLTEIGAWRVDHEDEKWIRRTPAKKGEKATYGGYYSQEEVKEIVEYACKRNVTIIPEIEMPGHSLEVLASYPELACFPGEYFVATGSYWPNKDILCAGKEEVFSFLQDVLDEIIALFPSEYIHIGGDEADKTNWKQCPLCQRRIMEENLSDEYELQSWFIQRIEKYLNSKNKKLIGWDEILEGGLSPEATVMSWRGEEGGIFAAKNHHFAIMTPGSHCYFDHYQGDPRVEPKAIGGYTTTKKVYFYEPIPKELSDSEKKYILGAQGNVWTEWISNTEHLYKMILPRMTALSEVLWTFSKNKNWNDFQERLVIQKKRFDYMGFHYHKGTSVVDISAEFDKLDNSFLVELSSELLNKPIFYTLDGSVPTKKAFVYKKPFVLKDSAIIKAVTFINDEMFGLPSEKKIEFHFGLKRDLKLAFLPEKKYAPASSLTDGLLGSTKHTDGSWVGFLGNDLIGEIELDELEYVSLIEFNAILNPKAWILLPKNIEIHVGESAEQISKIIKTECDELATDVSNVIDINSYSYQIESNVKYIKIIIRNYGKMPAWHIGAGEKSWLMIDEIIIK